MCVCVCVCQVSLVPAALATLEREVERIIADTSADQGVCVCVCACVCVCVCVYVCVLLFPRMSVRARTHSFSLSFCPSLFGEQASRRQSRLPSRCHRIRLEQPKDRFGCCLSSSACMAKVVSLSLSLSLSFALVLACSFFVRAGRTFPYTHFLIQYGRVVVASRELAAVDGKIERLQQALSA